MSVLKNGPKEEEEEKGEREEEKRRRYYTCQESKAKTAPLSVQCWKLNGDQETNP